MLARRRKADVDHVPVLHHRGQYLPHVFNLLGEPVSGRWTEAKKHAIRESRVQGAANLVAGMQAADTPPAVLVSVSAVGYYGDRGDEELTEAGATGRGFLAEVTREWEAASEVLEDSVTRVVRLRIGVAIAALILIFSALR